MLQERYIFQNINLTELVRLPKRGPRAPAAARPVSEVSEEGLMAGMRLHGFNAAASDRTPADRPVPDTRDKRSEGERDPGR